MPRLVEWWHRTCAFFSPRRRDRDLDEELAAHIDLAARDLEAHGLPPADARRRARLAMGSLDDARDRHRAARSWRTLERVVGDLQSALRVARRAPGFASIVILTLALGIGANTTIFSILDNLLWRPLPVHEPDRLIELLSGPEGNGWTNPLWEQLRARPALFDGIAAWSSPTSFSLLDEGRLEPINAVVVSGDFFHVLGLQPARGRLLAPEDDVPGSTAAGVPAVLSHAFWRQRFGAAPDVIGRVIPLDKFRIVVVGVAPETFLGPEVGAPADVMLPIASLPKALREARGFFWLSVFARLRGNQSVADAVHTLRAIQPELRSATLPQGLRADQLASYLSRPFDAASAAGGTASRVREKYRRPLFVLLAVVGFVLAIACANVANLTLVRADARRHEFAVRLALGASPADLRRQTFLESLLLAAAGALAGIVLAIAAGRLLVAQLATSTSRVALALTIDWRVALFTGVIAAATAAACGLASTGSLGRLHAGLSSGQRVAGPDSQARTRVLVVVQVACCLVLSIGAALLVNTFVALTRADLGFNPQPVMVAALSGGRGVTPATLKSVLEQLRAAPGVAAAAFSAMPTPMSGIQSDDVLENPEGRSLSADDRRVYLRAVGAGWFDVVGMRILSGRGFEDADETAPDAVAVINQTLARRFFGDDNPIGRVLRIVPSPAAPSAPMVVVGVSADAVYNTVREGVVPTLFRFAPQTSLVVVRAASGNGLSVAGTVSQIVSRTAAMNSSLRSMSSQAGDTVVRERVVAILSALFGGLALLLAALGVYGAMSFTTARRRGEMAVRRALGATETAVVRLVLGQTCVLVGAGAAIGLAAAAALAPLLTPMLYGVGPRDPLIFSAAAAVIVLAGLLASWMPARRAATVDPATALREG